MAGDTPLTVVGNLTGDPELRFTPSGAPVANFTIASTPRTFDRQSQEWKDEETAFWRCSIWREAAENMAEGLLRGARVIATGRVVSRSWETTEGEKRTAMELQVDEIGASVKYATVKVTKAQRNNNHGSNQNGNQGTATQSATTTGDAWATPASNQATAANGGGWDAPATAASAATNDPWATSAK